MTRNCHDISYGYHISMLTGCTGELVYRDGWGITGVRRWRLYEDDPEFEMPPVVGEDGSVQPGGVIAT